MPWLQLETATGVANPEALESALEELGALAITFRDAGDEPILEPAPGETPTWTDTVVTALFSADTSEATIRASLDTLVDPAILRFASIEDRDWQAEWQDTLKPRLFGEKLWVVPEGIEPPQQPAGVARIKLTPGMAFGTGDHPTTAMCMEWLGNQQLGDARLLDYGCGSGLLAIAGLALGAQTALAIDIDPQALEATRSNATDNGCLDRMEVLFPAEIGDRGKYDVLVANILSGTLISLGENICSLLAPGARLALSGVLAEQANQVASAWSDWADLEVSDQTGGWVLLTGKKHGI